MADETSSLTYLEKWEKIKDFAENTIIHTIESGLPFDDDYVIHFQKHYDLMFEMLKTTYNPRMIIKRKNVDEDMKDADEETMREEDSDVEFDDDDDELDDDDTKESEYSNETMPSDEFQKMLSRQLKNLYRGYKIIIEDYLDYVLTHFKEVEQKSENDFLKVWYQRWDKFKAVLEKVCELFLMLDAAYVVERRILSKNKKFSTTQKGYKLFKKNVFTPFSSKARDIILLQIQREREGESIDSETLKNAINVCL